MGKSDFRPRPLPSPAYPDLETFDRGRRSLLAGLGALLGAVLLPGSAAATPKKKGKAGGKKPKDGDKKPPPPLRGEPTEPKARVDEELEADLLGED